ncbi:MAG TPA: DUF502 domain-containing protein [Dongiaceae bacterium]
MRAFLKATIVGGVLFLLPLVLILAILGHALRLASRLVEPISDKFHLEHVAGISAVTGLAILLLVIVSFLAGIVARTSLGRRSSAWVENSLLGGLPQYRMFKSVAEGLVQIESASSLQPALISVDDGWQIGYVLERLENDWVAVFLPQAPTPMSGNVMYLPAARIRPLDITMIQAMSIVKHIGSGSAAALRGVDLTPPH